MDPGGLVRKGKFGGIALFDSALEEQLGPMDVFPLRGLYAEHCLMPDSKKEFSPPNNPDLVCTPQGELFFVVGEEGIDIVKWELKAGAQPTCGAGSMVEGRNAKTMAQVLEAKEAKAAGLLPAELIALRTYSGPMYAKYNGSLRWHTGKASYTAAEVAAATEAQPCPPFLQRQCESDYKLGRYLPGRPLIASDCL